MQENKIKINGIFHEINILINDINNDLSIGKVKGYEAETNYLQLSEGAELGENIIVAGFPLSNILRNDSIKITRGIVSSLSGLENNVDGSINPNNVLTLQQQAIIDITQTLYSDVLESLVNQNKTKAAERVYKLGENFELGQQISYRVINPNLPNNIDNES